MAPLLLLVTNMSLSIYTKSKYPPRRHKIVESIKGTLNLGSFPSIPLNWNIVRCTLHSIRRKTILPSFVLSKPLPTGLNYNEEGAQHIVVALQASRSREVITWKRNDIQLSDIGPKHKTSKKMPATAATSMTCRHRKAEQKS